MVGLTAKSLDELPESVRGICKEENGRILLDETAIRFQKDIDALTEAKRKEVNDHNATKAAIAAWKKLGASPEEVQAMIDDLQNRSGDGSDLTEKIANLQREKRQVEQERNSLKTELDGIKPKYEAQQKQIRETKTFDVLTAAVESLKGVDKTRLVRALKKDIALGLISLDESEEGLVCKTGETFEAYAKAQADDYNFWLRNTPGGSHGGANDSGSRNIPENNNRDPFSSGGLLDDDVAAQLDS